MNQLSKDSGLTRNFNHFAFLPINRGIAPKMAPITAKTIKVYTDNFKNHQITAASNIPTIMPTFATS